MVDPTSVSKPVPWGWSSSGSRRRPRGRPRRCSPRSHPPPGGIANLRLRPHAAGRVGGDGARGARARRGAHKDRTLRTDGRLTVDERRLDGNAAGGLLGEVFALEMTMVEGTCDRCGAVAHVGEAMAYISEIGTVLRCASCDNALI